jgi:uncharacterized cupredoxin-like copper-binding protein
MYADRNEVEEMKTHSSGGLRAFLLPILLAIALVTAFAVAACSDDSSEEAVSDEPAAEEHVDDADAHEDGDTHDDGDSHEDADSHDEGDSHDDGYDAAHGTPEEIVVVMSDDLTYGPNEVVVKAGQPVRLVLDNEGTILHDFTVEEIPVTHMHHEGGSMDMDHMAGEGHDEFPLHMALDGGDAGTLEFIPGESGEYVFHCTVPGHTENGMHGTLVVKALE